MATRVAVNLDSKRGRASRNADREVVAEDADLATAGRTSGERIGAASPVAEQSALGRAVGGADAQCAGCTLVWPIASATDFGAARDSALVEATR
jgi:hypothetical protein